ncbi:MAG: hypothetical protein ACRYGG_19585, partial [Janthinobacterium lividum]
KPKPNKVEAETAITDSPGPSPGFASARLKSGSSVRSGSVVSARESKEPKFEDGFESAKGPSAELAGRFHVGAEVAYKQGKMKEDGSQWIICNIIRVLQTGTKKR